MSRTGHAEHVFDSLGGVDRHDLERLRRSIVMLPPGHSAGALTREAALDLIEEITTSREETDRYRVAIEQLRGVLDALGRD
jgi:hypothetical protein